MTSGNEEQPHIFRQRLQSLKLSRTNTVIRDSIFLPSCTQKDLVQAFHSTANQNTTICLCFRFINGCYAIIGLGFLSNLALLITIVFEYFSNASSFITVSGIIILSVSVIGLFFGWYGIRTAKNSCILIVIFSMSAEGILGAAWIIISFVAGSGLSLIIVILFIVYCLLDMYLVSYIMELRKCLLILNEQWNEVKNIPCLMNVNTGSTLTVNTIDIQGAQDTMDDTQISLEVISSQNEKFLKNEKI